MDLTILIQEFAKAGLLPLAMAIVIYSQKKDLDKAHEKKDALSEKVTEIYYSSKEQADSFLELLASMKEMLIKLESRRSR